MRQTGGRVKGELMPQLGRETRGCVDAFTSRQLRVVCRLRCDSKGCEGLEVPHKGL